MSCCGGNSKESSSKMDSSHNNDTRKSSNKGKSLIVLLHLFILAILVLVDEISFLEDNLKYFVLGYVVLFVSIIIVGNQKRSDY
jgi:hypothetical protein